MEFEINKANLLAQIKILQNIATSKLAKTNPVLENLLIEAKENKLAIFASNIGLKSTLTLDFGLEIIKEGKTLIDAQKFVSIAETFKDVINFKVEEKQAILSENKTKIKLPISTLEYPQNFLEQGKYNVEFKIKPQALKKALLKVVDFRELDSTNTLGGISFKALSVDKRIKLCATNGNTLAVSTIDFENAPDIEFILPADVSILLAKSLSGDEVKIRVSEKRAYFEFNNVVLETLLISGMYPKYEGIIPNYPESDVSALTLDKEVLEDLFKKTLSLKDFVTTKSKDGKKVALYNIVFECGLITKAKFSDILEDYIQAEFKGEPITIALNPEYLEMVLKAADSDKITLLMMGPKEPVLFIEENYTALVMPVFLGR